MGYDTSWQLTWQHKGNKTIEEICGLVEKAITNDEDASLALDENGSMNEPCKWYQTLSGGHETFVRNISTVIPDTLFKLYGTGEDYTDQHVTWGWNGKIEKVHGIVTVTWPVSKLYEEVGVCNKDFLR